jgi:hypothetical protein
VVNQLTFAAERFVLWQINSFCRGEILFATKEVCFAPETFSLLQKKFVLWQKELRSC